MRISFLMIIPFFLRAKKKERYYQDIFARNHGGLVDVLMQDGSKCDIITPSHAIEVDFASKWGMMR